MLLVNDFQSNLQEKLSISIHNSGITSHRKGIKQPSTVKKGLTTYNEKKDITNP
jgi:hypothetical protein